MDRLGSEPVRAGPQPPLHTGAVGRGQAVRTQTRGETYSSRYTITDPGVGSMETGGTSSGQAWKRFVRRHWRLALLAVVGIAATAIAALLVFLWVVASTQAAGLVPSGLGAWTVGNVLTFILNVILWEILLVATWVAAAAAAAYLLWYKKLPAEERKEYRGGSRRGRSAGRNGGFSFFVALVWLVLVWTEGRWNLAFQDWSFNDFVYSWVEAGLVALAIVGVPGSLYVVWSLRRNS